LQQVIVIFSTYDMPFVVQTLNIYYDEGS
jgi:hypothetical protein